MLPIIHQRTQLDHSYDCPAERVPTIATAILLFVSFFPPTTVRVLSLAFFSRQKIELFLPSSTIVEFGLPTLSALSNCCSLFYICKYVRNLTTAGFELQVQHQ